MIKNDKIYFDFYRIIEQLKVKIDNLEVLQNI